MNENQLLIFPIFKVENPFLSFKNRLVSKFSKKEFYSVPIQEKPFSYGVKIKNIGANIFDGGAIKNIEIKSLQIPINHPANKDFTIQALNPDQEIELEFGKIRTDIAGQAWISFQVIPKEVNTIIKTFQRGVDGQYEKFNANNFWGDTFIIRPSFEVGQEKTNLLLTILASLTFIDAVWGIKETLNWVLNLVKYVLEFFTWVINYLINLK